MRPAALIAVVLALRRAGAAIDWMWELTVVGVIAMLAAGLLAGLAPPRYVERGSDARVTSSTGAAAANAVVVACLGVVALSRSRC